MDVNSYVQFIGAFKNTRRHIIIKQEGDKNEEELKKGHGIIYLMANAILNFHFDFLTPSLMDDL